ncbi:unnamed protein product [Zymoseptoria tritici ST99CH_1A5]|uniref:Fork-head domain-containing protein n=1 Tax=Zymoseptoria tritici ST99CH_1A5 TaxID=1276529 RepID=A0A1Y6L712_ZYMTR|nr:unnamed protein product [Zymoseptoria tritici ST99CH_1A5]
MHDNPSSFNFTPQELDGMPVMTEEDFKPQQEHSFTTPIRPPPALAQSNSWMDTPAQVTDHGVPSNVRDSLQQDPPQPSDIATSAEANNHALQSEDMGLAFNDLIRPEDDSFAVPELPSTPSHIEPTTAAHSTAAATPEPTTEEAYAMLKFSDCHCYIRSLNLVIVRDQNYLDAWHSEKKLNRKRAKNAQRNARRALDDYAREPSQPSQFGSQFGDDDPFGSGESLEGRPEPPGALSIFSEQGGPVAYTNPHSEDGEEDLNTYRRRHRKNNQSSSANSIAPQSLIAFAEGDLLQTSEHYTSNGALNDPREWAQLPVHPPVPEDIKKISREHLIIHYSSEADRWLLDVIGNGAYVNGIQYVKGDKDLELNHDDEIFISSLGMRFMLPENVHNEPVLSDEEDQDDAAPRIADGSSISPARRLSNLFTDSEREDEAEDEDQAEDEAEEAPQEPRPKLKLKLKKSKSKDEAAPSGKGKGKGKGGKAPAGKAPGKAQAKKDVPKPDVADKAEHQPSTTTTEPKVIEKEEPSAEPTESPVKKLDKAKADKPGDTAPAEGTPTATITDQTPPAVPLNIDPTSVLANLAPDQLPEKRKGPGRPPKNGLLSKRDESGVKRKTKEFERKGVPIPPLEALIAMVRQEQKAKDAANKAQARGEALPDMPMQSIEASGSGDVGEGEAGPSQVHRGSQQMESGSPGQAERRLSPRLPRPIPREASPIKPESAFTEEELKKPNMTYIYIIDEVLQNIEGGQADLQAIYDKIMKRWPYYKYKVGSLGWQSSVRHNLLSCERFRDAGKSGKGKLWAINHEHPLDNKKRKPTPPPRPPVPMQNQNGGQNQYGQPPFNGPYQQHPPGQNGQPPFNQHGAPGSNGYPPYGQGQNGNYPPGQNGPLAGRQNGGYANGAQGSHPPQQRPPPPPAPAPPANPFGAVVQAILKYRNEYLAPYPANTPQHTHQTALFDRATDYYSNLYHGANPPPLAPTEAEQQPFRGMKEIFERHEYVFGKKTTTPATNAPPAAQAPPANGQTSQPAAVTNNGAASAAQAPSTNGEPSLQPTATSNNTSSAAPTAPAVANSNGAAPAPANANSSAPAQTAGSVQRGTLSGGSTDVKMQDAGAATVAQPVKPPQVPAAATGGQTSNLPAASSAGSSTGMPPPPPRTVTPAAPLPSTAPATVSTSQQSQATPPAPSAITQVTQQQHLPASAQHSRPQASGQAQRPQQSTPSGVQPSRPQAPVQAQQAQQPSPAAVQQIQKPPETVARLPQEPLTASPQQPQKKPQQIQPPQQVSSAGTPAPKPSGEAAVPAPATGQKPTDPPPPAQASNGIAAPLPPEPKPIAPPAPVPAPMTGGTKRPADDSAPLEGRGEIEAKRPKTE